MKAIVRGLTLLALVGYSLPANAADVVTVLQWELHSSFWMSLHQRLIDDATRVTPQGASALAAAESAAWTEAVDAYRAATGRGNATFATPIVITTDALTQVADDATGPLIDAPLKGALVRAASVYRTHWWAEDDRANRFFIAYATALLRDTGAELVRQHEAVYRSTWPARIKVYITPSAGPFGAYTVIGQSGGVITTMSSRDEGYQGLRSLEMLLHEGSHAIVGPSNGTVGAALSAAATSHHLTVPGDLWHAILFATSGELTRRVLADRGVTKYIPYSMDLFTRVWPTYREPIYRFWVPYLNGEGTLEEAIDKMVLALPR